MSRRVADLVYDFEQSHCECCLRLNDEAKGYESDGHKSKGKKSKKYESDAYKSKGKKSEKYESDRESLEMDNLKAGRSGHSQSRNHKTKMPKSKGHTPKHPPSKDHKSKNRHSEPPKSSKQDGKKFKGVKKSKGGGLFPGGLSSWFS